MLAQLQGEYVWTTRVVKDKLVTGGGEPTPGGAVSSNIN